MSRSSSRPNRSLWSQTGPTPRLLFGAFAIAAIGLLGLTPREFFGFSIAWPYAALWGAVGWGRVGLSVRPMILLIIFGLVQDVTFHAPIGCFVILNLLAYGASAAIAASDTTRDAESDLSLVSNRVLSRCDCWSMAAISANSRIT